MKVLITGSTGMVGKSVLLECLDDPQVSSVTVVNRSSIDKKHEKLDEVIIDDFINLELVSEQLKGFDACFHCMGVSAFGLSEEEYSHITYDMTKNLADLLHRDKPEMVFIYVSGTGTDSSESGSIMWARVKGRTENYLLKKFSNSYMFRPGYIQPMRGVTSKTKLYSIAYFFSKPLYPLLKALFPKSITNSVNVGKAMINIALHGSDVRILENADINKIAGSH